MPLEDAKNWLASRRETHAYDDDSLRILSAKALVTGMNALIVAAKNRSGRIKAEGGEFGSTYHYDDVDAAKALVQTGIRVRSMLGEAKAAASGPRDLFDAADGWDFPIPK